MFRVQNSQVLQKEFGSLAAARNASAQETAQKNFFELAGLKLRTDSLIKAYKTPSEGVEAVAPEAILITPMKFGGGGLKAVAEKIIEEIPLVTLDEVIVVAKRIPENIAEAFESFGANSAGKAGTKVVDQAVTGIEWGKGIKGQGMPYEDYVASQLPAETRLPPNFKTIDFFDRDTGVATSVKTLDTTTAAKVASPSQVYSSLKGNVDAVANFSGASLSGVEVKATDITARELNVAIPANTTSAQWTEINRAIQYGQSKGVTVKITVVK